MRSFDVGHHLHPYFGKIVADQPQLTTQGAVGVADGFQLRIEEPWITETALLSHQSLEVCRVVSGWKERAKKLGLTALECAEAEHLFCT